MNFRTIRTVLLHWFDKNQRDLPWRRTYDPYHVWISEIMLQQTRMERVVRYFDEWMRQFPTINAVAAARRRAVLKAWEGLGYYSRARNIHTTAGILTARHGGTLPADRRQLLALPGIGPYTAAAILSIAFNLPHPVIDANVERLLARLFDIDSPIKRERSRRRLEELMHRLLPTDDSRTFNQAIMEFGALVCTPKNPLCRACPLTEQCRALRIDAVGERPVSAGRRRIIPIEMACGILYHQGKVFIQQRLDDDVWGGLWEFPGGRLKKGETPRQAMIREMAEETGFRLGSIRFLARVVHHYTRYRVTLHAFLCSPADNVTEPELRAAQAHAWETPAGLATYPFPAGHRRLIDAGLPTNFNP